MAVFEKTHANLCPRPFETRRVPKFGRPAGRLHPTRTVIVTVRSKPETLMAKNQNLSPRRSNSNFDNRIRRAFTGGVIAQDQRSPPPPAAFHSPCFLTLPHERHDRDH